MLNSKACILFFFVSLLAVGSCLFADKTSYFIGTSANGYQVPSAGGYEMMPIPEKDGWYKITIDFNEDNRDLMYDGHYYMVTDGTWNCCWGTKNYGYQPAPVNILPGGEIAGLGSIYIKENVKLCIIFDSNTKTVYDDYVQIFEYPRIYGDFCTAMNRGENWCMDDDSALVLREYDEGFYSGTYTIPPYSGEGEGYMAAVVLSVKYDTQWYAFAAVEQYKFDGSKAGMGQISFIKPEVDAGLEFKFDSKNKSTSISTVEIP